jgi:hypothetical protein
LIKDPRGPILYLRSFAHDSSEFKAALLDIGQWMIPEEHKLVGKLALLGPTIAIGRPSDRIPPSGSARLYVDDSAWKETVMTLLDCSQLVVLRIGHSAGLAWEFSAVREQVPPRRVLIYTGRFLYQRRASFPIFRQLCADHLKADVSDDLGKYCIVGFDEDWRGYGLAEELSDLPGQLLRLDIQRSSEQVQKWNELKQRIGVVSIPGPV